jgi:ribokinase
VGRVLVIGSSNTDLVCRTERFPRLGETVRGSTFSTHPGGKGANQAVAAARAGAHVTFVGAIGDDDFGRQRLEELRADSIDVRAVRLVSDRASGVALIVVDAHGDNVIVIVPGANDAIQPTDARNAIAAAQHELVSLTLEIPFGTVQTAVAANLGRTPTILNAAPFDPRVTDVLDAIDVLICNEVEASELLGRVVTTANATAAAADMVRDGPRCAVITLGVDGAVLATESEVQPITAPRVSAVDTTGAGDAFCGALCAWLAAGESMEEAVRAGVAAGSISVTRHGAQPSLPARMEILDMLQRMDGP